MKRALQFFLMLALCASAGAAEPAQAGPAVLLPPLPPLTASPIQTFRMLLATNSAGRELWLAQRRPAHRQVVESKIKEYESLSAAEREERLQTLQLRWYLPLLMKMTATERAQQLARFPQPDRAVLEYKLASWIILPPPVQKEILEHQEMINVFLPAQQGGASESALRSLPATRQKELAEQFERWNALPPAQRERILGSVQKYFVLTAAEKSKVAAQFAKASPPPMPQPLTAFSSLPPEQRQQAMDGFKKFAELPPAERAAFLKTAERWKTMTEGERESWRQMVVRLQKAKALTPPMPPLPSAAQRPPATALVGKER